MNFSTEVLSRASTRLAGLRADHESRYHSRRAEAYRQVPRIQAIDRQMQLNMVQAAFAAFDQGAQDAMEKAKAQNRALEAEREALLTANFAPGWLDDSPFCPHCGGSGWMGSAMCDCLKALCLEEQRKELSPVFSGGQSFENFRLDYFSDVPLPAVGKSPRAVMERTLSACREYARSFGPHSGHLLMNGGTGLGKTHLALAIGRTVADMGYSVCYETAPSLFSKLEQARFTPTEESRRAADKLTNCDLLIVDDLGTEMPGQFVNAALYSLLSSRLLENRATVITTNLNVDECAQRYSFQIASRLYGDFVRLTFLGSDVRILRKRGQ